MFDHLKMYILCPKLCLFVKTYLVDMDNITIYLKMLRALSKILLQRCLQGFTFKFLFFNLGILLCRTIVDNLKKKASRFMRDNNWNFHIQGVPRNMTVARRFESRFWSLDIFEIFSFQPSFTFLISHIWFLK